MAPSVPDDGANRIAIHPFRGAAGVSFGGTRAEVRERLGEPTTSYRVTAWADQLSDRYDQAGLVIGYGDAGTVDQIELTAPARAAVDGIALSDASSRAVLTALAGVGLEVRTGEGVWEVPAWGVALSVRGGGAGDRPFDTVTAFAHGPAPEPAFFGEPVDFTVTDVDPRGCGPLRLGMAREDIRTLLGEGLVATLPGRDPVDFHFAVNIAVTYDAAEAARRICVMTAGATVAGTEVGVGREYGLCVAALEKSGANPEAREAEIRLPDSGIRLLTARAADPTLPISAIVVQRAPAL